VVPRADAKPRAALRFAFDTLELREVVSYTASANARSMAVMRRIGMSECGSFDHPVLPERHALRRHVVFHLQSPHDA
jgi:RimJ/RimL family protein N-acetyltransferase